MADFEIVEVKQLDLPDMDVFDPRRGRAAMQSVNELLDGGFIAFNMRIHTPVGAIADPAGHSQLVRLIAHPGAEEDTLHAASHAGVPCDAHLARPKGVCFDPAALGARHFPKLPSVRLMTCAECGSG